MPELSLTLRLAWEDTTIVGLREMLPNLRRDLAYRMNAVFYREARKRGCPMIVYQAPTWAQFPVDVALGLVDGVSLCDNFFSIARPTTGPWTYTYLDHRSDFQKKRYGLTLLFRAVWG